MSDPTFGISITRIDNEPRPAVYSDMSIVGLVGTAPDANATTFPADTPVFMYSDDATMLAALGDSGTLKDAVSLLNAQLGEFQVAAKLVIVRVAEGVDTDATITNIVGNGSTTVKTYRLGGDGARLTVKTKIDHPMMHKPLEYAFSFRRK